MKSKPVEPLTFGPSNDLFNEQAGDPAPAPLRFGEDIYYCPLPAFANCRRVDRAWQDRSQLNTSAPNNRFRFIDQGGKPADVVAATDPLLQWCPRSRAQDLKSVAGNVSHIQKHPRSMPHDDVHIPHCGATNFERSRSQLVIPDSQPNVCNTPFLQLFASDYLFHYVRDSTFSAQAFHTQRRTQNLARRDRALSTVTMPEMEVADWASLSDEELLEHRISTLGLRLEGTPLEPLIRQLYDELSARGFVFHPSCHVGDEWFVPIGIPAIFIPFFLVHDRLRALERTMMLEVEGGTPEWFMKLMRHEAGHAFMYAYRLTRKKKWQELFGQTSREETPDTYRPRPFSRSYVMHLEDWYAQSHPDEDFAETFAVWLTPGLDWRKRYSRWRALQKLEYVDELMRSLVDKPPLHAPEYRVADYDCLNVKLKTYYARKRKLYEDTYPDFYDADLRQLFAAPAGIKASAYLQRRRRRLLNAICQWTNENRFRVNQLLARLTRRCDQLGLHVLNDDPQQDFRVSAFITTLVMNYLFTGKFKRTK